MVAKCHLPASGCHSGFRNKRCSSKPAYVSSQIEITAKSAPARQSDFRARYCVGYHPGWFPTVYKLGGYGTEVPDSGRDSRSLRREGRVCRPRTCDLCSGQTKENAIKRNAAERSISSDDGFVSQANPVLNEERRRAILDLLNPPGPGSGHRTLPPVRNLAGYDSQGSRNPARSRPGPSHARRRSSRRARARSKIRRCAKRKNSIIRKNCASRKTPPPG